MIEKKISYEINIEKPSKTKPVKQGGVLNYLGKQKTVNAPVKWRSSPKHPVAHLSYITKDEEKILIDLNLYGSLKGKPNKGPFGLPSLQGSGGGAGGGDGEGGGNSGGPSDSAPGGSDDGTGHGGPGPGAPGGPGDTMGSSTAQDAAANQAASEAAAQAASDEATVGMQEAPTTTNAEDETGIMSALSNLGRTALQNVMNNPVTSLVGMVSPLAGLAMQAYSAYSRGVTGPSDHSQATTSVQTSTPSPTAGNSGIATIQSYAPLYNPDTGNPTMDAYIRQLRINLGLPV